jgi:hypothetical protein
MGLAPKCSAKLLAGSEKAKVENTIEKQNLGWMMPIPALLMWEI